MFKFSLSLFALLFTSMALAQANVEILLDVPEAKPKGLVIIAPAKKYLMRERLFSNLALKLKEAGYLTVRFNWSPATLEVPGQELERAAKDLHHVVSESQARYGISAEKTILISKSFSTKALSQSIPLARSHMLLTPNCSVAEPFQATYQDILHQPATSVSIFISNEDPYCDIRQIYGTLQGMTLLPRFLATHGDHNFVVTALAGGTIDFSFQDQVIDSVVAQISATGKNSHDVDMNNGDTKP